MHKYTHPYIYIHKYIDIHTYIHILYTYMALMISRIFTTYRYPYPYTHTCINTTYVCIYVCRPLHKCLYACGKLWSSFAFVSADDIPRVLEGEAGRAGASLDSAAAAGSAGTAKDIPVGLIKRNPASLGWLMAAAMRLCDERPGDCVGGPVRPGAAVEMDLDSFMELRKRTIDGTKDFRSFSHPHGFNDDVTIRRKHQLNALFGWRRRPN